MQLFLAAELRCLEVCVFSWKTNGFDNYSAPDSIILCWFLCQIIIDNFLKIRCLQRVLPPRLMGVWQCSYTKLISSSQALSIDIIEKWCTVSDSNTKTGEGAQVSMKMHTFRWMWDFLLDWWISRTCCVADSCSLEAQRNAESQGDWSPRRYQFSKPASQTFLVR